MSEDIETIYYDPAESTEDDEPETPTALAVVDAPAAPVVAPQPSRAEIEALKATIKASNREMTDAQFTVFMAAARHLGLDPLARQVVPIFQGGRMTVQTTIDGFRLIAERTRKYRGQVGPFWCGPDGEWRDVWLADGAPAAAKVGVKRSDFDEVMWGVARTKSYHKDTPTWRAMPDVMIAKVAESLALRKAFPAELSGAYTAEELDQMAADESPAPTPAQPEPPARAPERPANPAQPAQPAPAPAQANTRVEAALMNRTIVAYLATLRVKPEHQRKRLGDLFAKLDTQERKATERDVMDTLADAVAKVEAMRERQAQGGKTANGHASGHDLQASGAFAQHGA